MSEVLERLIDSHAEMIGQINDIREAIAAGSRNISVQGLDVVFQVLGVLLAVDKDVLTQLNEENEEFLRQFQAAIDKASQKKQGV